MNKGSSEIRPIYTRASVSCSSSAAQSNMSVSNKKPDTPAEEDSAIVTRINAQILKAAENRTLRLAAREQTFGKVNKLRLRNKRRHAYGLPRVVTPPPKPDIYELGQSFENPIVLSDEEEEEFPDPLLISDEELCQVVAEYEKEEARKKKEVKDEVHCSCCSLKLPPLGYHMYGPEVSYVPIVMKK